MACAYESSFSWNVVLEREDERREKRERERELLGLEMLPSFFYDKLRILTSA